MTSTEEKRAAVFSDNRLYRYELRLRWAEGPLVQFIGLNPSTADEVEDDPTIRRCKAFAKATGGGGMAMTNLFAWRSAYPSSLLKVPSPIGEDGKFITVCGTEFSNRNDYHLFTVGLQCPTRIACWGTHGKILYRVAKVKMWLSGLSCLAITKSGFPQHPLYLKSELKPIPYL